MLQYITWDFSPVVFDLGFWKLYWYGLMWATCIIGGFYLLQYVNKHEPAENRHGTRLIEYIFFGGLIGARLGQVLFYDFAYFWEHPIEIVRIWHGGLASHGGAIGILLATFIYCRNNDYSYIRTLDVLALGMPLFGALIRLGNLFNSEIVGKPTDMPWGFIFVRNGESIARHPSQVYEMLLLSTVWLFLMWIYRSRKLAAGTIVGLFFVLTFFPRFVLEFWKADASITQWLNLPLGLLGVILLVWSARKTKSTEL
jgi:prolipoprotein diacylglyceryl transferase